MLMLKQCYTIFHVENVTLSVLKVKGYSLHHYNNVFLFWNFFIHHIAPHQPVDQKFHLFTHCFLVFFFPRILFWKYIITKFIIYFKVSAKCSTFSLAKYTCQIYRQQKKRDKLDDLTYNYCDICTMLMLIFQEF